MRTIGLIGGLSWESTVIYYQIINRRVRERLGGSHSADSLIWSVDYTTVEELIFAGRWDEVSTLLADAGMPVRTSARGAATRQPPCRQASHISSQEASNA
ncbi:hypothetical protein AB0C32_27860, partial [Streptosporangium sp. NPDC048865]